MAEDGKEGQPSIIVLVQDASEDDVVQVLTTNTQTMVGDETEFTINQLENAITAGGQQLLILSEDATESVTDQEESPHQETRLVCQEGPDKILPEYPAAAAADGAQELQPKPRESPDGSSGESPTAVSEEKDAGGAAAPDENSEGIHGLQPEPQESPDVNNSKSPNAVSEEKAAGNAAAPEENSEGIHGLQPEICESPDVNNSESLNAIFEKEGAGSPAAPEENFEGIHGLQPEPQESPDVNSDESLNAVSEEKAARSPGAPGEHFEGICGSESKAEPQATPQAPSQEKSGRSGCGLVSESEMAAPLHENIQGNMPSKSEVVTDACSQQESTAMPDGAPACDARSEPSGSTGVSSSPLSDLPPENPEALIFAAEAGSQSCLLSQGTEHEVPVDRSNSEITRALSAAKEASEENVDHSGEGNTNEVIKASSNIPSFPDHNIQLAKAKEENLCADQSTSEHSNVRTAQTCQLKKKISEKVAKVKPQHTGTSSEKPLKKRLRPEIRGETADPAVSPTNEFKAPKVPNESEEALLAHASPVGSEEKRASSDTSACPLHKETEHVVSIHVDKLPDRTAMLTRGKVQKSSPSKAKEKATSNGDPAPIPGTDTHGVGSLQETGDAASLHEQTNLKGEGTVTELESSEELPGKFSREDHAVADEGPEKPSSPTHPGSAFVSEGRALPAISHSSKMDVQGELGPAKSATEPSAATDAELTEMSRDTNVRKQDEPAGKSGQPQVDAAFIKQPGVSGKSETKGPRRRRKKVKSNCLGASQTSAQSETVSQQKSVSPDRESMQDTKQKHIDSTKRLEQSLQSEQEIEVLGKKAKTVDEPPRTLTEKENPLQSSSETTMSREMPKLQKEVVQNHAGGSLMEDELQEPVNGLTSEVLQGITPDSHHDAPRDAETPTASKNASQESNKTAGSSQDSSKIESRQGNLPEGFRAENMDFVHDSLNTDAKEKKGLKRKGKAPKKHRGQGDCLEKPQIQSSVGELREEHVHAGNSHASNRHADSRGAAEEGGPQPSCSRQYEPKPSCSWAVDDHEPTPSCSWEGAGVNVLEAREEENATSSGGKLLAALDLVPCREGSPLGTSRGGGKRPLPKIRKNKQAAQEHAEVEEEPLPKIRKNKRAAQEHAKVEEQPTLATKPWNLRVPTKPRKRLVIPDSDDDDFDAYDTDKDPSEAQKLQSEKAFDELLDHFKTEQAQKTVTETAPARKKRGRPPKRKLSTSESLGSGSVTSEADGRSAKVSKVKTEKLAPKESNAGTSERKRTERKSALIFKLNMKRYAKAEGKGKSAEKSAPTGTSAKISRKNRMQNPEQNESPAVKTSNVAATSAATETQQVRKLDVKPAGTLPLAKSASDDDIQMPRTNLRAGDIRIRCQKPSYVSAMRSPQYHCSKCDFVSSRMQNIVWHYKRDCPFTKSFSKTGPKSSESQKGAPT